MSKDRLLKEAQRTLDLMVQASLSLTKNFLFSLKSRQSVVLAVTQFPILQVNFKFAQSPRVDVSKVFIRFVDTFCECG